MYNKKKSTKMKKNKIIFLMIMLVIFIFITTVFGRYITSSIHDFFLRSKEFYFYSDKLKEEGANYQVENWSGVDSYEIVINMNSRSNNLNVTSYDIDYDISYAYSDNIKCDISKTSGTIYASTNSDSFNIMLTPNTKLDTGDTVWVEITATSKGPYKKTLIGKFTLVVGKENLSYTIDDIANRQYLELKITNTLSYYTVEQSFGSHKVGDRLTIDEYLSLSEENKRKCYSARVNINFNPENVLIDITNGTYKDGTNVQTTKIDGYTYVDSFSLSIDAITSVNIRFYKTDVTKDYTYNGLGSPVITVSTY
ncbi:MAG: hypothetical protein KIC54_01690 [Clostridium sp.]|nr:hypothetical protein [Clostridium sp.]